MYISFYSDSIEVERGFNLTWTGLINSTTVTATGESISHGQVLLTLQHQ